MRQIKSVFISKNVLLIFIFATFFIHFYMLYDQIHYLKTSKIAEKWSEYKISIDKLPEWINYLELENKINIFKYSIFLLVVWFGQNILSEQIINNSILQKCLYLIYVSITFKFAFIFFFCFLVMNGLLPSFGVFLACFPIWFFYRKFKLRATLHIMLSYFKLIESIFMIVFKNQLEQYITLSFESDAFENLTSDHFINISKEEKKNIYELISAHKITKMYIENKDDLNAFSIGLEKQKIIAISSLILKKFIFSELYVLIGHELGHIFHNDTTKKIKILIMHNVFLFGGHILIYFTFLEKNDLFYMVFCFEIFKNVFSTFYDWITNYLILHNFEYAADEYGKNLFSKIELDDFRSNSNFSATNMLLKISENNGFMGFDMRFLYSLNFSHPSILQRIEKLKFY